MNADGSSSFTDPDGNTFSSDAEGNESFAAADDPAAGGALDGAFGGGDLAGVDMPPPADDPMGAALDNAAAQSDAGAAGGQAPTDPMADMPDPGMDSDMPKPEEDDQGGGAVG